MTEYFSPLRYPGGKGKLVPFFERLIIDNGLSDGVYIEPYVGGGAVALSLLLKEYVSRIVINDKDRSLYAFWYSVLHHSEELCRLIADTPVNALHWVVSYDNSAFIKDLYKDFRSQEFELNYSANNNGKGTEVMFFSDNCRLTEEMFNKIHIK